MNKNDSKNKFEIGKKSAIVLMSIVSVFIILMAVFAVVSFPIADTVYDYNGYARTIKLGLDMSGGVSAVFEVEDDGLDDLDGRVNGTINSLQSLLVSKGYTESTVTKGTNSNGNQSIRVEVPDVDDPERVLELIGRPASISFKGEQDPNAESIIIGRDHISSAFVTYDDSHQFAVGLRFNDEGTKAFAQMTQDYLNQQIYIYDASELVSAVTVNSQITNGHAIITQSGGGYTYQEAYDFATRIQSGSLGVTLKVTEVRNISATLGDDAIRTALIAGAIGVGLIFIFLGFVYRGLGLAADIALCVYIVLLLWFCAVLPWVQLTLPGIAGILLSIGMAVDANVIIFERIKDGYSNSSKNIGDVFKQGFSRSASAIIDGNVTTLIGAVVLWILGSSAIVGFAVTLFIGIILSMFTSLVVTRYILKAFLSFGDKKSEKTAKFFGLKRAAQENVSPVPADQNKAVEVK